MKFEVNEDDHEGLSSSKLGFENNASSHTDASANGTQTLIDNSILPSLSAAASLGSAASAIKGEQDKNSPEDFFLKLGNSASLNSSSADSTKERQGSHLVQPVSRFRAPVPGSLVVEKNKSGDGMPGMKISRSGTTSMQNNISSKPGSFSTSLDTGKLGSFKPFAGYTLGNHSNTSLAISEGDDHHPSNKNNNRAFPYCYEPFGDSGILDDEDDADLTGKLAPYGGFSRADLEDVLLKHDTIFETAPWKIVKSSNGNSSLFNAMDLVSEKGIVKECKWVGAMSLPIDAIPSRVLDDICLDLHQDYNCEAAVIDDFTFQGHYKSFCKHILWPTLHYQIPDDPKSKAFEDHSYEYYKKANQLIADRIIEAYKREKNHLSPDDPNNVIWIHDYHLLLVPQMIRERLPEAKIGFFLHVSFPSSEVFRCLAQRAPLIEGLLGADCITFQTEEYVRHFLQTCSRIVLADTNEIGVMFKGRLSKVNTIPVGIDAPHLLQTLNSDDVKAWKKMIRERWKDQTLIVSRDKLDKLRGVKQKFLAYERFLKSNPEKIETTVLIQIFLGSPNDEDYASEVTQIISRINSLADNLSSALPVVVLHHDISFVQYLALQSEAELFIVSSMREGLNLTCHEFIVATSQKKSPLILSEFTGSSHLLSCNDEGALLINPWDIRTFSETIEKALNFDKAEAEKRWKNCYEIVLKHDSLDWVRNCLSSIQEGWESNQQKTSTDMKPFTREVFESFCDEKSKNLYIICIDDLGHASSNGIVLRSTLELSRIATALSDLLADENSRVFFVSFMRRSELSLIFKNFQNLGLIAELGGYIKLPMKETWVSINKEEQSKTWVPRIGQIFEDKSERLPGSKLTVDDCTIRLNARQSMIQDPKRSLDVMGDCVQYVNNFFSDAEGLHATIFNDSVIVQQRDKPIQAIKFLMSYYSSQMSPAALIERFSLRRADSYSNGLNFDGSVQEAPSVKLPINGGTTQGFFYAGGLNPIDEDIYDYVASYGRDNDFESTLTVAVNDGIKQGRTSANYSTFGQNELLSILSRR